MRPHLMIGLLPVFSAVALMTGLVPSAAEDLPPEIQVDRLLMHAEREIEDGEGRSAVVAFERILAVCEEQGVAV